MAASELRERYQDLLLDRIRDAQYPSPQQLDRYEATICTPEDAESYVELLFERVQNRYPSKQLLDRIDRITTALVAYERATQDE